MQDERKKRNRYTRERRVLGIGVAGERHDSLMRSCSAITGAWPGGRVWARCWAAKTSRLLAVKGTGKVPVFDADAYAPRRADANRALKADAMTSVLSSLGSAGAADYFNYLGEQPKKYFSAGVLEGADNISGASVAETILVGKAACHACVIACGRVVRLDDGEKRKGPEYETLVGFGPNLGLTDPATATRLGELCDRYGVDFISMSGTIGLAFRLYELRCNRQTGYGWTRTRLGQCRSGGAVHPSGGQARRFWSIPGTRLQKAG